MSRNSLVLVFGEDENDARSVAELLRPRLSANTNVRAAKSPPIFAARDSGRHVIARNVSRVAETIGIYKLKAKVSLVVVHRDCDECEPAHVAEADRLRKEFSEGHNVRVVAAVPAWELETWLMLFPEALRNYRPCWRPLELRGRRVGQVRDAKEELRRLLRSGASCPDYRESDAPGIATVIATYGYLYDERKARSDSFAAFLDDFSGRE